MPSEQEKKDVISSAKRMKARIELVSVRHGGGAGGFRQVWLIRNAGYLDNINTLYFSTQYEAALAFLRWSLTQ